MESSVALAGQRAYWPRLDGLRAVAVLAVMLYHFEGSLAPNGYIGVDIFFVLSGFLITSILQGEVEASGSIDLRSFYRRRLARLMPALCCVCLAALAVAPLADRPLDVAKGVAAALTYVSNWWIYSGHDTVLLQHTWTLAIEEQFYVVWPVLFATVHRHRVARVVVLVITAGAWLVIELVHPEGEIGDVVTGSYSRAFGIALGCAAAMAPRIWRYCTPTLVTVGFVALVLFVASPDNVSLGTTLLPAVATVPVVIGLTAGRAPSWSRLLEARPLRWIGVRSYGLYLWHFPIGSLIDHNSPVDLGRVGSFALAMVASFVVAACSFRYVEAPLRSRWSRSRRQAGSHHVTA